jgi:hypothetical protein
LRTLPALLILALLTGCAGPSTGPLNGVLLVYDPSLDQAALDRLLEELQITVPTVEDEDVFIFSSCPLDSFSGDLRGRRTILFTVSSLDDVPADLMMSDGIWRGTDVWAEDQDVFAVVLSGDFDQASELSGLLEDSYNRHLTAYLYGSFVATQMSSPDRIDSLRTLGFSLDIPKSYSLESWEPASGFIQYQRSASEDCLLILSVRWIADGRVLSADESVLWREAVARTAFYDSEADSVDRSRVQAAPLSLGGMEGFRLLGMWRNAEHLNAGAFTCYVLLAGETRYLIDMEVFHEHGEKEPYIREGWIIMNSFVPGS